MTYIRMIFKNNKILKHLCLSGMLGIIQSKKFLFYGYILLPLLCSMLLNSPNFDVKSIAFPQFWPGAFSPNCWKKPCPEVVKQAGLSLTLSEIPKTKFHAPGPI